MGWISKLGPILIGFAVVGFWFRGDCGLNFSFAGGLGFGFVVVVG